MHTIQNEIELTSKKETNAAGPLSIASGTTAPDEEIYGDREEKLLELQNYISVWQKCYAEKRQSRMKICLTKKRAVSDDRRRPLGCRRAAVGEN